MERKRITLLFRIKHWFTYHPWLKLIALALAVMLWFYVSVELAQP